VAKAKEEPRNWENRIVGHEDVSPAKLIAHPMNWRVHPKYQQDALARTIDDIGFIDSVTVSKRTGTIINGHLRVTLATRDKIPTVPVEYVDLDPEEEKKALATFDVLTYLANVNDEMMAGLLTDLDDGFITKMAEEAGLFESPVIQPEATGADDLTDAAAALQEKWQTEPGQIWTIGAHRLCCGDSCSPEDVGRLLDGNEPTLMVTDPPYGVNYDPKWRLKMTGGDGDGARMREVPNDDRVDWSEAFALFPGDVMYAWSPAGEFLIQTGQAVLDAGFRIRNQLIWVKTHFPISRGHYTWQHEPCWYATKDGKDQHWRVGGHGETPDEEQPPPPADDEAPEPEPGYAQQHDPMWYAVRKGAGASWVGGHGASTKWEIPLDKNVDGGHSTQKPVECMERPIRNHAGDVYDPFCGSGTTMVAAERQNRRCFAMEIDPGYAAVILERMERLEIPANLEE
jgi:DNA modification methylase